LPNEDTTPPVTKTNLVMSGASFEISRLLEIPIIKAAFALSVRSLCHIS
jgi:hypothetical protein